METPVQKPISELSEALEALGTDKLLIQTANGTKIIQASILAPALLSLLVGDSAASHNAIYRGKCLGSSFTSAQSAAIRSGKFTDLYIGDYWTINGRNWRIGALDYWYRCGDTDCTTHHALIVPDAHLYTAAMNATNTTEGAYIGSQMYKTGLDEAKTIVNAAFGSDHILNHREHFQNAVSNGKPSGGTWYDSTVDLMNEAMVYGTRHFTAVSDGSTVPNNYTIDKSQLPLFRYAPWFIHAQRAYWCWLRDVVSAPTFASVSSDGGCNYHNASYVSGVRPAFAIY